MTSIPVHKCSDSGPVVSCCCNAGERMGLISTSDAICQLNGNNGDAPEPCTYAGSSCQEKSYSGHAQVSFVSGWMYMSEQGQMCWPYLQQQLYEGLSSGFLPDELLVYPVYNRSYLNPIPLMYFKQFPDQVSTGFVYLSATTACTSMPANLTIDLSSGAKFHTDTLSLGPNPSSQVASRPCANYSMYNHQAGTNNGTAGQNGQNPDDIILTSDNLFFLFLKFASNTLRWLIHFLVTSCSKYIYRWTWFTSLHLSVEDKGEACWLFEDNHCRKKGPHSLWEIYSWHCYGYLRDTILEIYHCRRKSPPHATEVNRIGHSEKILGPIQSWNC